MILWITTHLLNKNSDLKPQHCYNQSLPLDMILSQFHPLWPFITALPKIHLNVILPYCSQFLSRISHLLSWKKKHLVHCCPHNITIQTILGDLYMNNKLCCFIINILDYQLTSSLLSTTNCLSILFFLLDYSKNYIIFILFSLIQVELHAIFTF